MSEKVYSIASPSICTKEKSHVVTIGPGPNRNERTYSFSITPANTENKNDVKYPICIAPYARHKAVREDNAIVTATKVRAKGALSSALEEAIRQNEIDASVSNTIAFELNRIIDVANLKTQQSQRIDSISVQLISADESIQHERIFDIDHIEGVESKRPNERTAVVHRTDETQLITSEYKAAQIIEQDILKNTLREFTAAGVDELPEWVKVARVLYGEEFYEDVSSIVTREIQGEYNESTLSNIVPLTIDASINTEIVGEIKRKELETRFLDDYGTFTTEHELQASLEEFDLFEGMGTPVYLPDYDLFARIQRELAMNIEIQHEFERKTIIENTDLFPRKDLTPAEKESVIDATRIDFDSSIRMKELYADSIMINDSNKHVDVFATESSEPYTFERINDQYADIVQIHNSELIVKELETIHHDTQVSVKKESVFTVEVTNSQESEITSRILLVEDIAASTTALKIQNTFEVIESRKEEFIRLTELTANIAHIDGADRLLNESQADVFELVSADKEGTPVLVDVAESILSELKTQDILTTIEDHDFMANKTIKELPASIEEFDLFEGMGIPVYLPEFDLFGRIHKKLETRITFFEDASKLSQVMQMQIDQTVVSEKIEKEILTIATEEVASDIVPVTLDAQCIDLDASYRQNTQQALITEQKPFNGIREYYGGIISEITLADRDVITDTNVIETVDAARE
ncbi:hypothetical protein CN286_28770, partial [Bacillus anthracis]